MYYDNNGNEITAKQIKDAFVAGNATLINGRGIGKTTTSLSLAKKEIDTRGECHSVWDEVWTSKPRSYEQCISIARGA